jgi:hypothetical protein
MAALPLQPPAHAKGTAVVSVRSQFVLDRYGFAVVNESVRFTNNASATADILPLTFGLGNLSTKAVAYNFSGAGFTLGTPSSPGGPFAVSGSQLAAGSSANFVISVLLNGVVTTTKNGSLSVLALSSPSISAGVDRLVNVVKMPPATQFKAAPAGMKGSITGSNNTYSAIVSGGGPPAAQTSVKLIAQSVGQDFHPLRVYSASRMVSPGPTGSPLVTDVIKFNNMGTTALTVLQLAPLAASNVRVTILPQTEPRLNSPITVPLNNGAVDLSFFAVGYPYKGVAPRSNFTLSYQYALGSGFYSVSGGKVTMKFPSAPPLRAFVDSYSVGLSLPLGAKAIQSGPGTLSGVTPWQRQPVSMDYGLSIGWTVDAGVPGASIVFILLLVGLFAARTRVTEEEEIEEESSTELASDMIKAFDEKTNLINSLWPEIEGKDRNEMGKEYFDELRGRLDSFRSRALQRLNEVRQKSTSQKFFEVVNMIQMTEREVDRASKDKLNLYQQYFLNQMRKEVYDRLLPQYTKRLEKALNQLSDELHQVQREAKLL